jgi:hypothetical protein
MREDCTVLIAREPYQSFWTGSGMSLSLNVPVLMTHTQAVLVLGVHHPLSILLYEV